MKEYKPLNQQGEQVSEKYLPCRKCSKSTLVVMLSNQGGWCLHCYEDYCREAPSSPAGWKRARITGAHQ